MQTQKNCVCLLGCPEVSGYTLDLNLLGAVADPSDHASVGLLRIQMLGSLVRSNPSAPWAAISADVSLGLSPRLVTSLLETMEEGECGV